MSLGRRGFLGFLVGVAISPIVPPLPPRLTDEEWFFLLIQGKTSGNPIYLDNIPPAKDGEPIYLGNGPNFYDARGW